MAALGKVNQRPKPHLRCGRPNSPSCGIDNAKTGIDRVRFSCPLAAKATEHLVSFSHKWYLKMVAGDMSGSMALPNSDL